ncbi:MAG: cation-binding protein [Frankiales bacterium]|nr:cation-binding protein [Frankiales bacterium]
MDIADLVLNDHHRQRQAFALLDEIDRKDTEKLQAVWADLAAFLEVHAAAEEAVLYPVVLKESDPTAEETKDAIGDHNKIRDAIARASRAVVGSEDWWDAVGDCRKENTEHMGEEEDEVLPHLRQEVSVQKRSELGLAFEAAKTATQSVHLDESDKDPEEFVAAHT